MPEPHAATAAAAAGGISATLAGSVLGLGYDALLGGLLGGLLALMHQPPDGLPRQAVSLAGAILAGALWAPLAVAAGLAYLPWLSAVNGEALRIATAAGLGLVAQVAIPAGLAWIKRKGDTA